MLGSFIFGVAFRRSRVWWPLAGFSFAVGVGFMVLGSLAVTATAADSELAGLAERGPIGLFLIWLVVVGGFALHQNRQPPAGDAR